MTVSAHNDISVRVCSKSDATGNLVDALELIEQRTMKNPWSAQSLKECFDDAYKMLVIFKGVKPAGFAVIYSTKITTDLLTIAIDPMYQGQGLGKLLLSKTLQEALAQSADECFLEVRASNFRAQNLYSSLGFEKVGVRKGYYEATGDSPQEDAFTMCLASIQSAIDQKLIK